MERSLKLGSVLGIELRVHASWFILIGWVMFSFERSYGLSIAWRAALVTVLIFLCVIGHELSHCLAARYFGIKTRRITLYLMGGVADLERMGPGPKEEFFISLAGPLFNATLALVAYRPFCDHLGPAALFNPTLATWPGMLAHVFWANPALALFNLIPAFPMDGGRLLRSLLTGMVGFARATQIAVFMGLLFAILIFLYGMLNHRWLFCIISLFIAVNALAEKRRLTGR